MNQQLAKDLIIYILKPKELKQNNILKYKQIKELLKNTELVLLGEYISKIVTTITALANTRGGIIIYGISKELNYYRKSIRIPKDIINQINTQLLNYNYIPKITYTPITQIIYKKTLTFIIIEVEKQNYLYSPIYIKHNNACTSLIRHNGSNIQMAQPYIHMLEAIKSETEDDIAKTKHYQSKYTNIKDIEYFEQEYKKQHQEIELNNNDLFHSIYKFDRTNYRLFYVLSFSLYPQLHFINLNIHIYNNINTITKEPYIIDGSIKMMFQKTILYIKNILKLKLTIRKNKIIKSTEYNINILKELLYNALIHRDYSPYTRSIPITLTINPDNIIIENPGIMIFDSKEEIKSNIKITRNPNLKRINDILLKEDIPYHGFSYIRRISNLYKTQLPKIVITKDATFKVTIFKDDYNGIYKNSYSIDNILKYCIEPKTKLEIYNNLFKPNKIDYTYFYNKYIIPLIKNKSLEYTINDKPKSKNQKIKTNKEMLLLIE